MNSANLRTAAAVAFMAVWMVGLVGCASVSAHLPWHHKTPPPPEVSTALTVTGEDGAVVAWPQFWLRNDVVLELSAVGGTGSAIVAPRPGLAWPVRVAFRVTPGSVGELDVRGAQRVVLPVPASGSSVDLELPPGIYRPTTKQIVVTWGPAVRPVTP